MDCQFVFIDPHKFFDIMRTFLINLKNDTLIEIKLSRENLWQQMIQLSDFFQYSMVLIPKQKCLFGAGQIGCRKSTINTQWSSRREGLGHHALMVVWYYIAPCYDKSRMNVFVDGTQLGTIYLFGLLILAFS